MTDLLSEFLRRWKLRNLEALFDRVQRQEKWLLRCTRERDWKARASHVADALAELLEAQSVLVLSCDLGRPHACEVLAASGVQKLDSRSEVVSKVRALASNVGFGGALAGTQTYFARDRRHSSVDGDSHLGAGPRSQELGEPLESHSPIQQSNIDELCEFLGVRAVSCFPLDEDGSNPFDSRSRLLALAAFEASQDELSGDRDGEKSGAMELVRVLGSQLTVGHSTRGLTNVPKSLLHRRGKATLTKIGLAVALSAIAIIPVPQQISATGLLRPEEKYCYYAPTDAIVTQVFVGEGQDVSGQQPLISLSSRALDNEIDRLQGEMRILRDQIAERTNLLQRGNDLTARESDRIEAELSQLYISLRTNESQYRIAEQERLALQIHALGDGRVATWDAHNRLINRPVKAGHLLLTTYEPEGEWYIEISVPDRRVGLVDQAARESDVEIRFSLTSSPDQVVNGKLVSLGKHARNGRLVGLQQDAAEQSYVLGKAKFEARQLALKKDGATAQVTIDCGRVPAIWLVVRDAYWSIASWLRLYV